jgi:glycosyltransferase involved in cell wall biosynthesis
MTLPRRIAAFGFRSIPPRPGCSGADKFAEELYVRLAGRGYRVTGYNRVHDPGGPAASEHRGVRLVNLRTFRGRGLEALWHSAQATAHIIRHDTGDVVHVQNGGNSVFIPFLRLFGKRVYLTEDGAEWDRGKWPWYARLYLRAMTFLTAIVPNGVVFDNVFVRETFEKRFRRRYHYIPYGSEPQRDEAATDVLERLGLAAGEYFLFVGRFIPEKGLQYLIPAFERVRTHKKLVVVGGATQGSEFAARVTRTDDPRILFPGYVYGADVHTLMRRAYAYIQPSDLEGLSPAVLECMGLGTPVICSDIRENLFVVGDTAVTFRKSDVEDLAMKIRQALEDTAGLARNAARAARRSAEMFSWESVTTQYETVFYGAPLAGPAAAPERPPTG